MLSKEDLEKIEATVGGECRRYVGLGNKWEIVLRSPTGPEWQRYLDRREQPRYKTSALQELIQAVTVYPSLAEVQALMDKWPGIAFSEAINMGLQEMMGMVAEERGKG